MEGRRLLLLMLVAGFVAAPALRVLLASPPTGQAGGTAMQQLVGGDAPVETTTTTALGAGPPAPAPVPVPVPVVELAPPAVPVQPITIKGGRGRTQVGKASWYEIDNGTCAHVRLPKGTIVRVVNLGNGKEALCRVADRGPFLQGRVIDLDLQTFQHIASPSEGVVDVRISW